MEKRRRLCVAGIEWPVNGEPNWLRPVSNREYEQLVRPEHYIGDQPVLPLDVVRVGLLEHKPHSCQTENHLIDSSRRWEGVGRVQATDLLPYARVKGQLWTNGYSTGNGTNDKVPQHVADHLRSSLALVRAEKPVVRVIMKETPGGEKPQVRLSFKLEQTVYDLSVTDPIAHEEYRTAVASERTLDHSLMLCVSLSEPSMGYRYKLVAGLVSL